MLSGRSVRLPVAWAAGSVELKLERYEPVEQPAPAGAAVRTRQAIADRLGEHGGARDGQVALVQALAQGLLDDIEIHGLLKLPIGEVSEARLLAAHPDEALHVRFSMK